MEVKFEVAGPVGRALEFDVPAALEHSIEDRLGQIRVVEDAAPGGERLVGRQDHGAAMQVAVVDDLEEDVRRIDAVAEIADLIADEDTGMRVAGQDLAEATVPTGPGQVV